jgi:hypothetical protein
MMGVEATRTSLQYPRLIRRQEQQGTWFCTKRPASPNIQSTDFCILPGVAYQLSPDDPLADTSQCQADIKFMTQLGANTIRVYHVDSTADHDGCMNAFADAGIYVLADLDTFTSYIIPVSYKHPNPPGGQICC